MHLSTIVLLIVLLILDRIFQKKAPRLYKKLELPANIVMTVVVAVYCGFLVYAVYDVLTSSVSHDDKVFFTIFIGVVISIYGIIVLFSWKRWRKERSNFDIPPEDSAPPEEE